MQEEKLDLEVDNIVDSPETAQPQGNMTPEEALADLGISTRLSEQFLMSQVPPEEEVIEEEAQPEAPVEPETAPEGEVEPEVEKESAEDKDVEIESMKTDIELLKKLILKDEPQKE